MQCNHVDVASRNHDITKVFDQRICCNGGHRQTSFITGAMALLPWWRIKIGAINFTTGALAPSQLPIVARGLPLSCTVNTANRPCGKRLIVALHDICGLLPLWWGGAHCCLAWHTRPVALVARVSLLYPAQPPSLARGLRWMHPPWHNCHTCPWQHTSHLQHTQCTCLWGRTHLWQGTRHLQCICHIQPWCIHAAGHSLAQYGCRCILRTTTYYIWLLHGSHTCFLCYCQCSLRCDNKKWLSCCWHCCCGIAINIIIGTFAFACQCGWSTSMKRVDCACCNQPSLLLLVIRCKTFFHHIPCNGGRGHFLSQAFWHLCNCRGCSNNQLKKGWWLRGMNSHFPPATINRIVRYHKIKKIVILVIASCNTDLLPWSLQSTACKKLIVAWETFHYHTLTIVRVLQ